MSTLKVVFFVALVSLLSTGTILAQVHSLQTVPVTDVRSFSATFSGRIVEGGNADGEWVQFQYGTDPRNLNLKTEVDFRSGLGVKNVHQVAIGLLPDTTYFYTLSTVKTAWGGENRSADNVLAIRTLKVGAPAISAGDSGAILGVPGSTVRLTVEGASSLSKVFLGGVNAPIVSFDTKSIRFQVPTEMEVGVGTTVYVENNSLRSNELTFVTVGIRPELLDVTDSTFQHLDTDHRISPDASGLVTFTVVATGLGRVSHQPGLGIAALASPFSEMVVRPQVIIGNEPAEVTFAGLMPGQIGVYQLNVRGKVNPTDVTAEGLVPARLIAGDGSVVTFVLLITK